jgi:protein gp37
MQKSRIEWCVNEDGTPGYTSNPVKGYCPNPDCPLGENCYARRWYRRFGWNRAIEFWTKELDLWTKLKPRSRVFVGSTIELFGPWVPSYYMDIILARVRENPQATFIFLTKKPENLRQWSPFPKNCWVGATVTDQKSAETNISTMWNVLAPVRFISFEPLLGPINLGLGFAYIDWCIIGAETGTRKGKPPLSEVHKWAGEITKAADNAGRPYFLKDNLRWPTVHREWPKDVPPEKGD